MFAEPSELCFLVDTEMLGERTTEIQNNALSKKGKEDDIVGDEDDVEISFPIVWIIGVIGRGRSRMGYKKHGGERAWRWIINK